MGCRRSVKTKATVTATAAESLIGTEQEWDVSLGRRSLSTKGVNF